MKESTKKRSIYVNKSVIFQKIDDGLVGFDIDQSFLYTFNETAEFIFKKVKLGWGEEKIIEALAKNYTVAFPILKKDVKALIKNMIKHKIIMTK
ncbi:MAG: PqqD family protein [bacterium]